MKSPSKPTITPFWWRVTFFVIVRSQGPPVYMQRFHVPSYASLARICHWFGVRYHTCHPILCAIFMFCFRRKFQGSLIDVVCTHAPINAWIFLCVLVSGICCWRGEHACTYKHLDFLCVLVSGICCWRGVHTCTYKHLDFSCVLVSGICCRRGVHACTYKHLVFSCVLVSRDLLPTWCACMHL